MTKRLTGAARKNHTRTVLLDEAREILTLRHPSSPQEVATLLVAAERKVPTRSPDPIRPEILAAALAFRAPTFVPLDAAPFKDRTLGRSSNVAVRPDVVPSTVVIRYNGHGLGHTYRADVPLGVR